MPNRLAHTSSPYLLQHQNNPVDWFPWGEEALQKARIENKPIFLSIGYAACHWCHVMERESFEDQETAELMNRYFVNIKVDREERPDLDGIYMQAVVALTRHGGWPMSVFLTPEGEPFYGGTYFPPVPRYQMPSFRQVLAAVADAWEKDRENVRTQAGKLSDFLKQELGGVLPDDASAFTPADLKESVKSLETAYDRKNGGWGKAPKFPQPMAIEFLLHQAARGDDKALKMAEHALDSMAKGGMYDVVGGGFSRYSVDDEWLVPHFEKMLYDNAQLARVYLHGWLITRKPSFKRVVEETLEFLAREMTGPEGGFYSSLDADSEGEEGKFYVWTVDEIRQALPNPKLFALVSDAYGLEGRPNFEGKFVLQRQQDDRSLAKRHDLQSEEIAPRLAEAHAALLGVRAARVRPATDDKRVTAWNGLALIAFSEAAKYLERESYKNMAMRNAQFLMNLAAESAQGILPRTWRDGRPGPDGFLEDYAAAALGMLSLYETSGESRWYAAARDLTEHILSHFNNADAGFFDTPENHETLLVRPRELQDNATPSGNSLAARLLLAMHAYTGSEHYLRAAEQALSPIRSLTMQYPTAFANWLCAADLAVGPLQEVVLVGEETDAFHEILRSTFRPRTVTAPVTDPAATDLPPLAEQRPLVNGRTTAYVCEGFVCLNPTNDPQIFRTQLDSK